MFVYLHHWVQTAEAPLTVGQDLYVMLPQLRGKLLYIKEVLQDFWLCITSHGSIHRGPFSCSTLTLNEDGVGHHTVLFFKYTQFCHMTLFVQCKKISGQLVCLFVSLTTQMSVQTPIFCCVFLIFKTLTVRLMLLFFREALGNRHIIFSLDGSRQFPVDRAKACDSPTFMLKAKLNQIANHFLLNINVFVYLF